MVYHEKTIPVVVVVVVVVVCLLLLFVCLLVCMLVCLFVGWLVGVVVVVVIGCAPGAAQRSTIVVTTSPIPSHPSPVLLRTGKGTSKTLESVV